MWARGGDSLLWQIDPEENRVVEFYGPPSGSGGVAADDQTLWVTAHDSQRVWRVTISFPATG